MDGTIKRVQRRGQRAGRGHTLSVAVVETRRDAYNERARRRQMRPRTACDVSSVLEGAADASSAGLAAGEGPCILL